MSEPFLAEVKIFGFTFAPRGWAQCDGQILPINQHQSLYSLLGTTYGGDGRTTFGLPEMRGRVPLHEGTNGGSSYQLGQKAGQETHTLSEAEMPAHSHAMKASSDAGNTPIAAGKILGKYANGYDSDDSTLVLLGADSGDSLNSGGSQAHNNMQPYITLNFCIALQGLFPSRS